MTQSTDFLSTLAQTLYDKKAKNIICLDVQEISSLTRYFIIAEGTVDRHIKALSQAVREKLKDSGEHLFHIEGETASDWIVMDCGEVIIHLFVPEMREKYALEELWHDGKIVELKIEHGAAHE